jgi:hypothetical protein
MKIRNTDGQMSIYPDNENDILISPNVIFYLFGTANYLRKLGYTNDFSVKLIDTIWSSIG